MADDPTLEPSEVRDRIAIGDVPLDDPPFTDEWVAEQIEDFDNLVLDYRGEVPTRREETETVRPVGVSDRLLVAWPLVVAVTSITVNGTALTEGTDWELAGGKIMRLGNCCWHRGAAHVVVYEHGFDSRNPLKKACTLHVEKAAQAARAGGSSRDKRASGDVSVFVMPDWDGGKPTGWDGIDDRLNRLPDFRLGRVG